MIHLGLFFVHLLFPLDIPPKPVEVHITMVQVKDKNYTWSSTKTGGLIEIKSEGAFLRLQQNSTSCFIDSGFFEFTAPELRCSASYIHRPESIFSSLAKYPLVMKPALSELLYVGRYGTFVPSGDLVVYNSQDDTLAHYQYESGEKHGWCIDQTPTLRKEFFDHGNLHGTSVYYDSSGSKTEITYNQGVQLESRHYFTNGALHSIHIPDRSKMAWRKDGSLNYQVVLDKQSYICTQYYANGKMRARGRLAALDDGDSIGWWIYYDKRGGYMRSQNHDLGLISDESDELLEIEEFFEYYLVNEYWEYPGGPSKLREFLEREVRFSHDDDGSLIIRANMTRTGRLDSVWVHKAYGYLTYQTRQDALNAVKKTSGRYEPMRLQDKRVMCTLQFVFRQ